MCGEGGMAVSEWARMKSLRMARLWMEGFRKRSIATYEMGWVVARAAVAGRCKVPEDYPFDLKGLLGEDEPDEEMPAMSEEDAQKNLDAMRRSLMARMRERAAAEQPNMAATPTDGTEGGGETTACGKGTEPAMHGGDGDDK